MEAPKNEFSNARAKDHSPRRPKVILITRIIKSHGSSYASGGGGGQGILVEYGSVELVEGTLMEGVLVSIGAVLDKYETVFQTPQGLPPQCYRDHVITLKGGLP